MTEAFAAVEPTAARLACGGAVVPSWSGGMVPQPFDPRPGSLVAGRYRIVAPLGQGGFGIVLRAHDEHLKREVALKVLRAEALDRPGARDRFLREIELARQLTHPHAVRLLDVATTDSGVPAIAWELLRGRSLDTALLEQGAWSADRVVRLGTQVLKCLMEAHGLGIVHRDIKPANLFLCDYAGERDFVKVLDFGIATLEVPDGRALTQEGTTVGTPQYMAPEQVLALPVDARTDLYALGLVLAEALTGARVYDDESAMRVCIAQASGAPVPLPEAVLRSPLGPVLRRATDKMPQQRYDTAAAMLRELEAVSHRLVDDAPYAPTVEHPALAATVATPVPVTSGSHVPPPAVIPHGPAPAAPARRRWIVAAMLGGGLVVAVLVSVAIVRNAAPSRDDPHPTAAPSAGHREMPPRLKDFSIRGTSAQQVLDRLVADGWHPGQRFHQSNPTVETLNFVITGRGRGGTVQFHLYQSADDAHIAETIFRNQYGGVARDDRHLLLVSVDGDRAASVALVQRLIE